MEQATRGENIPDIDDLAERLIAAKENVREAHRQLLTIEEMAAQILGNNDEGVAHFPGGEYTISTTGVINRKLVGDISEMQRTLDRDVFGIVISWKPMLNIRELKNLAVKDPKSYQQVIRFIESKPGKTKVEVKSIV